MKNLIITCLLGVMIAESTLAVTPPGGSFTLTDQDGRQVSDSDFRGKYMLVFFGFTHCPDLCPTTLLTMAQITAQMKEDAKNLVPIFITVDPERDTPAEMKAYISHFSPAIVGLTGTREQIVALQGKYKIYAAKVEDKAAPGGYTFDHSGYMYLMDPKGEFLMVFAAGSSPQAMATKIKGYMHAP